MNPPPTDFDPLLTAYFHAQRPAAWPPPPPRLATPTVAPRRAGGRARLTLAASVGVLFAGLLLLPGGGGAKPGTPVTATPGVLAGSTADAQQVQRDLTATKRGRPNPGR